MATPGAGELVPAAPAPAPAPAGEAASPPPPQDPPLLHDRSAKRGTGGPGPRQQGAGARILSLGVQAAVMAAALAVFVLFAAASALLLLVLVVAARAFRHHRGSRYRVPSLGGPAARAPGLAPADLRRIPCFAFPAAAADAADPCAVCLEAARAGERWRALPSCGHAFHAACVDRWLSRSPACPVCRAAVAVAASTSWL
ncbi:hypothetical protein BS78_04G058700 [Paspalum vaginatum]|nr:hypothetical protein BS78_04G058700 [Paspalum vaginatum]